MKIDLRFQLQQLKQNLATVWQSSRAWCIINIIVVIIQSILPLLALYIFKKILDYLQTNVPLKGANLDFGPLIVLIALGLLTALAGTLGQALMETAQEAQALDVSAFLHDRMHARSSEIELEYLEDPIYHDLLHRAQQEVNNRPTRIVENFVGIALNSLSLLGILVFIFSSFWGLGVVLIVAYIPGVVLRLLFANRLYLLNKRRTAALRKLNTYNWKLTSARDGKEVRLFDLGGALRRRYRNEEVKMRVEQLGLARTQAFIDFGTQFSSNIALFVALGLLIYQTAQGAIVLSTLVITYQAFGRAQAFLSLVVNDSAKLYENNLYLSSVYELINLPLKTKRPAVARHAPQPMRQGIRFQNVSFSYPHSERVSLQDITLTLFPGKVIGVVGENGCGKSTLVKLLLRFYDPDKGAITIDGIDYRDIDPKELRRQISAVFQDFNWYQLVNIHETISLSVNDRPIDFAAVELAAEQSTATDFIKRLPKGFETMLGNEYAEGAELSVGQWQKLALARALYRDSQVLILDEPSSAFDPLAEAEVFDHVNNITNNRTVLLITHRLSNVRDADWIYVMDNGYIVEQGVHDDLIAKNGKYQRMFETQARQYRERVVSKR